MIVIKEPYKKQFAGTTPAAQDTYPTPDMSNVLQWAKDIFVMAQNDINIIPSLATTPSKVIKSIDTQIDQKQRFWQHELLQAAKLCADKWTKYDWGYNLWSVEFMNLMGWRIKDYTGGCPQGYTLDSVTRVCNKIDITIDILPTPAVTPDKNEISKYLPLIVIGGVAIILLMKKKEKAL